MREHYNDDSVPCDLFQLTALMPSMRDERTAGCKAWANIYLARAAESNHTLSLLRWVSAQRSSVFRACLVVLYPLISMQSLVHLQQHTKSTRATPNAAVETVVSRSQSSNAVADDRSLETIVAAVAEHVTSLLRQNSETTVTQQVC